MQHATTPATGKLRRPVPRRATALATVAAAAALLLARPSPARAQNNLNIDVAYGNSPYTLTYGYGADYITVGDTGVGVLNQTAYQLSASDEVHIGNAAGSNGTYNLGGTGELDTPNEYIGLQRQRHLQPDRRHPLCEL